MTSPDEQDQPLGAVGCGPQIRLGRHVHAVAGGARSARCSPPCMALLNWAGGRMPGSAKQDAGYGTK
jgi:hypothetical protein